MRSSAAPVVLRQISNTVQLHPTLFWQVQRELATRDRASAEMVRCCAQY